MRPCLLLPLLILLAPALLGAAQTAPPAAQLPPQSDQRPRISVTSRLVSLDVVVREHDRPVSGLTKDSFLVLEDGRPQTVSFFEAHSAADASRAALPQAPVLPPDTYTNLPVAQVTDSVTVLLLDGLNTEASDQLYVRREMIRYLHKLPAGRRIAVFTLGTQLRLLQGFTDDVSLLLAALDRKEAAAPTAMTIPKSQLAAERNNLDWMAEAGVPALTIDAYSNFANESDAAETDQRIALTLEAMEQLARYLSGIPGRKNLVWFSGSFPLQFFATEHNPFHDTGGSSDNRGHTVAIRDANEMLRSTIDMLTAARVAVYPVDARGVLLGTVFGADQQGDYARVVSGAPVAILRAAQDSAMLAAQRIAEEGTMDELAKETGGRAVYEDNGFQDAMADAVKDGANFYTLAYDPANRKYDGRLRHIEIRLARGATQSKAQLDYRRTYYADDRPGAQDRGVNGQRLVFSAAMHRGVPAATQIIFEAHVAPADPQPVSLPVPPRKPPLKGPMTQYAIDYAIGPRALDLTLLSNGERSGQIVIEADAWSDDGKLLTANGTEHSFTVTPQQYRQSGQIGLQFHQIVEVPSGPVFLRLGVYEPATGQIGSVEIPLQAKAAATTTVSAK